MKTTVVQKTVHSIILPGKQTQRDEFSNKILRRFESILNGPHSGAFCQIMNIFVCGYWNLNIDLDLLLIRYLYEKNNNVEKIELFSNFSCIRSSSNEERTVSDNYQYI